MKAFEQKAESMSTRRRKLHGHRFEAKHHERFESSYRRRILPPTSTLRRFGLKKGMNVAGICAGSKYFLIPGARRDTAGFDPGIIS
jgi:hypothetical protein